MDHPIKLNTSWHHDEVHRCPVCNRLPKLATEHVGGIYFTTIKCSRIFKEPHVTTTAYSESQWAASLRAMKQWNIIVKGMQKENEQAIQADS